MIAFSFNGYLYCLFSTKHKLLLFYFSERFINGTLQGFPWGGE